MPSSVVPRLAPVLVAVGIATAIAAALAADAGLAHAQPDTAARRRPAATRPAAAKPATKPAAKPAPAAPRRSARSARDSAIDALWPVKGPAPLPGSILPAKRIVAYYGNPNSKRMGILGELPADQMLARLDREVAAWTRADPALPVQPALHLVATVAQGAPGEDGMWRRRENPKIIEKVHGWAKQRNAILFLDIQIGKSTLDEEMRALLPFLQRPDVHLGIDPEFAMTKGGDPGRRVGTYDARHINQAIDVLAGLVTQYRLPPKVLVIHRFTGPMVTNSDKIKRDPRVQVVMHMDGWGPPYGKRATWARYIRPYPVQYTGFKLFYKNDTKAGHPLMKPADILALHPDPVYIQYQ